MGFSLNLTSQSRLFGVHPDLQKVVKLAAQHLDGIEFIVTEGVRTAVRQAELVKIGASRTMESRHLDGHAVDLAAVVSGELR